jgi:hypothetical protein
MQAQKPASRLSPHVVFEYARLYTRLFYLISCPSPHLPDFSVQTVGGHRDGAEQVRLDDDVHESESRRERVEAVGIPELFQRVLVGGSVHDEVISH